MSSTWLNTIEKPKEREALKGDIETDILVIGGGLAGATTAYLLSKAGRSVVLIEKDGIDNATTAYTTGFITYNIDTNIADLAAFLGKDGATKVWESGRDAIDFIERVVKEENIDCEFMRCSNVLYATSSSERKELQEEQKNAHDIGFELSFKDDKKFAFATHDYLEFPNQAKFHAIKYLIGLRDAAARSSVKIFERTEAKEIKDAGARVVVATNHGTIKASHVVVATYDPFNHPKQLLFHKAFYVSYIFEVEIPRDSIPEGMYEDLKNPYHYFRVDYVKGSEKARMIVGGEDHRHDIPVDAAKNFAALEEHLYTIVPKSKATIVNKWEGWVLEPVDGLPYIGPYTKDGKQHVATAFSGNGMTYSAIAGMLLSDTILGKKNQLLSVYGPRRIPSLYQMWIKGRDYVEEFFGAAAKNFFRKKK